MGNNLFCAIDLQNDFISGSIGSEKAIELAKRVPSFLNIVEESENNYIIFTKDTHFADTYAETQEGKKLPNNLVPMEKVIEYFNINVEYLVSINKSKNGEI